MGSIASLWPEFSQDTLHCGGKPCLRNCALLTALRTYMCPIVSSSKCLTIKYIKANLVGAVCSLISGPFTFQSETFNAFELPAADLQPVGVFFQTSLQHIHHTVHNWQASPEAPLHSFTNYFGRKMSLFMFIHLLLCCVFVPWICFGNL